MFQDINPTISGSTITICGFEEKTAYTYDGAPLRGIRDGSTFYVDVAFSDVRLTSPATGGTWDSADNGVALSVNGRVFGFTSSLERPLRKADAMGYSVRILAKREGMYCEDIPMVKLLVPDNGEVEDWIDACVLLGKEVPYELRRSAECSDAVEGYKAHRSLQRSSMLNLPVLASGDVLFVDNSVMHPVSRMMSKRLIDVSTEFMPVPKGSSAKPHIRVSAYGTTLLELNARNRQYEALSRHVGEKPYIATCYRCTRADISHLWRLVIVYIETEANLPVPLDSFRRLAQLDMAIDARVNRQDGFDEPAMAQVAPRKKPNSRVVKSCAGAFLVLCFVASVAEFGANVSKYGLAVSVIVSVIFLASGVALLYSGIGDKVAGFVGSRRDASRQGGHFKS